MKSSLVVCPLVIVLAALPVASCTAGAGNAGPGNGDGDSGDGDISVGDGDGDGDGGDGDISLGDGDGDSPGMIVDEPETCADARASRSYTGCDFWPTVLANPVFAEYDFAVVVANGQDVAAEVIVEGPNNFSRSVTVEPGTLETILLPWVTDLKGPEFNMPNTNQGRLKSSLAMKGGAYHLVTSVPVSAYQFNPLQYKKQKGECGRIDQYLTASTECRAASNDASILLPSTAMTGNYRVGTYSSKNEGDDWGSVPGGFGITATRDNTNVIIELSSYCHAQIWPPGTGDGPCIMAGPEGSEIPQLNAGDQLQLTMNAGDVVQLVGAYGTEAQLLHADVSGSVINASAPIQVIGFNAIAQLPDTSVGNADHLEETILPAEVIGTKYIVAPPTAYGGNPIGHVVRIFGNVDGTQLTYPEGKPAGAPDIINAGEMVQIPPRPEGTPAPSCAGSDLCYLTESFVVEGSQPFAVGSFLLGGDLQVPNFPSANEAPGDPAFSMMVTPEQFRKSYTFLAPADFEENYADILVPAGAEVTLDGAPLAGTAQPIGASGWSVVRALLSPSGGGIHTLATTHDSGVGLQVMGFGAATSYYYPGGLNLIEISEPPVIVVK